MSSQQLPSALTPAGQQQLDSGLSLPVMEIFSSIQGEGYHTGKAAWFVRIGGCDVGCHWCDVKESWDAALHPLTPVREVTATIRASLIRSVVITGGEPLLYNLEELCRELKQFDAMIHLETSGVGQITGQFDWICLSPKASQPPRQDVLMMADELKVIIHDESDFQWAEQNAGKVKSGCKLFLQPEWSQHTMIMPKIVDYVTAHPQWMVSLQTHKFMNIP